MHNTSIGEVSSRAEPPVDVVTQELYHTCDQDPLNTTYTYIPFPDTNTP
ncbi:MAG: hypothetical protein R2787_04560 [Saprospiraceae bacterium]